jgi:prepilin peptidase CpaA
MGVTSEPGSLRAAVAALCLMLLIALLVATALSDLHRRKIPDTWCMAMAMLALPYGVASGWLVFPDLADHFISSLALGTILLGGFCFGLLSGGEVKMMAALGLWLSTEAALDVLFVTLVAGGVLAVITARHNRYRLSRPGVPYGVAIALAGTTQAIALLTHLLR